MDTPLSLYFGSSLGDSGLPGVNPGRRFFQSEFESVLVRVNSVPGPGGPGSTTIYRNDFNLDGSQ